jgi:hypothetical protein
MSSTGLLLHPGMNGNAFPTSLDMSSKLSQIRKRISKPKHAQKERQHRNKIYHENLQKYAAGKGHSSFIER